MILLLGAGNNHTKKINELGGAVRFDPAALVTLDIDPNCKPDVLHDLNSLPYPFDDNKFSEIHAYEVLEHTGTQGDWRFFFGQFMEFWRILKPGGRMFMSFPIPQSVWALGDPGHTRIIPKESFTFLSQSAYDEQVGLTTMTDYRHFYHADFSLVHMSLADDDGTTQIVVIEAIK
jgi:hypothetical protein